MVEPLFSSIARMKSIASQQRANRTKATKKNCQKRSKANEQQQQSVHAKRYQRKGQKNKRRWRRKSGTSREKRNIQEAQAESEAYKRISIIVDVIIIFHFQSKRYPIIAPERLPIYLPFFLLSFSLSFSLSCRTQHKESPRIKPTFHLFTRNARVELKCFLLLLFKRATRR